MDDSEKRQVYEDAPHQERTMSTSNGRRRSTVATINMNKNLDAK